MIHKMELIKQHNNHIVHKFRINYKVHRFKDFNIVNNCK